jgi:hypothetical protein
MWLAAAARYQARALVSFLLAKGAIVTIIQCAGPMHVEKGYIHASLISLGEVFTIKCPSCQVPNIFITKSISIIVALFNFEVVWLITTHCNCMELYKFSVFN